jgi:hypothetical protein
MNECQYGRISGKILTEGTKVFERKPVRVPDFQLLYPLTAPQLSISQKALGMLPEDGNIMPKHVGDTIHN